MVILAWRGWSGDYIGKLQKYPSLPINVIVSLILMFVMQVEVQQELEWKGSGLGAWRTVDFVACLCISSRPVLPSVSHAEILCVRVRMITTPYRVRRAPRHLIEVAAPRDVFSRALSRVRRSSRKMMNRGKTASCGSLPYCAAFVFPGHLSRPSVGVVDGL